MPSSDISDLTRDFKNPATTGVGMRVAATPIQRAVGTDSDSTVDFASAYVELSKKDGSTIGTFLVGQQLKNTSADTITVGDKSYRIALRFKTNYKPYSVTLTDAQREYYTGTQTPKWYSSDIVLDDHTNGTESAQRVWMNNPLRYSDETFYQSGMDTLPNGKTYTVLQIVRNKGWMIPYVCCMFTVVGLAAQFGTSLRSFLEKSRNQAHRKLQRLENTTTSKLQWLPAIILVGSFGLWGASTAARSYVGKVKNEEIRLDLLGQIPITKKRAFPTT